MLIDPVLEQVDRDLGVLANLGLTLDLCINTHCHADHITGSGEIKRRLPAVRSVISKASGAAADVHISDGEQVRFGDGKALRVLATPGHTEGCVCLVAEAVELGAATEGAEDGGGEGGGRVGAAVFTGDALLIGGCGRTDFQGGDAGTLYESVHSQLFALPGETVVFPAHDYKGRTSSTVADERATNPRLTKPKQEFIDLMAGLGLPYPKKIDVAVPANLVCGV